MLSLSSPSPLLSIIALIYFPNIFFSSSGKRKRSSRKINLYVCRMLSDNNEWFYLSEISFLSSDSVRDSRLFSSFSSSSLVVIPSSPHHTLPLLYLLHTRQFNKSSALKHFFFLLSFIAAASASFLRTRVASRLSFIVAVFPFDASSLIKVIRDVREWTAKVKAEAHENNRKAERRAF